ncbi:MAG: N-acetylglucosamine-6-phosphate deacetylase [Erysipelotrichaceae bacterium]|nr:N-acetylglucosamine-6-phosphate deacetylase [Erysipelotrichaceae bacterium]
MPLLLKHAHVIVDGNREYLDGAVFIEGETIKEVFPQTDKIKNINEDIPCIDLKGSLVMPGFFDSHTHGIKGMSFDHADQDTMDSISKEFAKDGTTSFLASLSYDLSEEEYLKQLGILNDYVAPASRFMGIHMEGPFLSEKHLGMGDPKRFIKPDEAMLERFLNASDKIRQMTIAYELEGAKRLGEMLHKRGIKVMCGHSDAVLEDLDENVEGFTHLFNAMRSLHHRDITLVNCAFMNRWQVELIGDGNHIKENVLRLVLDHIDRHRIMLVSDSSIARGLADGEYVFLSKPCTKKGTTFISHDGHFAGSVVSINDEMKVLYGLGAKYTDLLLYSSYNAFKFYGLDKRFGTVEKGKYADLVVMDDELNVKDVYIRGERVDA